MKRTCLKIRRNSPLYNPMIKLLKTIFLWQDHKPVPQNPAIPTAAAPAAALQALPSVPPIEASVTPRPAAVNPGDYQEDNRGLIAIAQRYKSMEDLWLQEAKDSEHPQRQQQAQELAKRWAEIRELSKQFYRQWNIEP